jgi:hypothetical protein
VSQDGVDLGRSGLHEFVGGQADGAAGIGHVVDLERQQRSFGGIGNGKRFEFILIFQTSKIEQSSNLNKSFKNASRQKNVSRLRNKSRLKKRVELQRVFKKLVVSDW